MRSSVWPIHQHELKKIVPMLFLLFLLSFNQSALWNLKDALVVTASGAEAIPFIKVWAILPCTILTVFIFTKLSNRYPQEKVFYLMTSSFLLFFALFTFVVYPHRDLLHPFESAAYLESALPAGFKGLISMYRYWTFTGFYVLCELWSTIVISVLFWDFANRITNVAEAPRFYSVLSLVYNVAIIAAGLTSILISRNSAFNPQIPLGTDAWEQTMMLLMLVIITSGILAMGIFRWMHRNVLGRAACESEERGANAPPQRKNKLSLRSCLLYVGSSKYLLFLTVVVVSYNLVINLAEIVWKDQLKHLYPLPMDYNYYTNNVQAIQGMLAIFLSLGIAQIIKHLGWTRAALITPVSMALACTCFFGLLLFQGANVFYFLSWAATPPLATVVFFGSAFICISKACKYSVFDSTKEMALVPFDPEFKFKGKVAIDGIGARSGKSGGSMIHQVLLMLFASVAASAPYIAAILLLAIIGWLVSIRKLGAMRK